MLGVGTVIGTGIFVLSAEAAQKAGPGMMISFVLAAFTCAFTALCYAELASMVPLSGSAYTYSYVVLGELIAWMVGWGLILEYAVAASAVSVGLVELFRRAAGANVQHRRSRRAHARPGGRRRDQPAGRSDRLADDGSAVSARARAQLSMQCSRRSRLWRWCCSSP